MSGRFPPVETNGVHHPVDILAMDGSIEAEPVAFGGDPGRIRIERGEMIAGRQPGENQRRRGNHDHQDEGPQ